jgi:homogentisate 1,2-dioxygenase
MPQRITPITVFCRDTDEALALSAKDNDSRASVTGPGTLSFHTLIAEHGAGVFTTLYVPLALKDSFKPPVGGIVKYAEGVKA